ncbi:unnamed protein product, partial [Rotaria socialis]
PRHRPQEGTQDRADDLRRPGAAAGHGGVQRQAHAGQGGHAAVAHRRHLPRAGPGLRRPGAPRGRQPAPAQGADAGAGKSRGSRQAAAAHGHLRAQPVDAGAGDGHLPPFGGRRHQVPGPARPHWHHRA